MKQLQCSSRFSAIQTFFGGVLCSRHVHMSQGDQKWLALYFAILLCWNGRAPFLSDFGFVLTIHSAWNSMIGIAGAFYDILSFAQERLRKPDGSSRKLVNILCFTMKMVNKFSTNLYLTKKTQESLISQNTHKRKTLFSINYQTTSLTMDNVFYSTTRSLNINDRSTLQSKNIFEHLFLICELLY